MRNKITHFSSTFDEKQTASDVTAVRHHAQISKKGHPQTAKLNMWYQFYTHLFLEIKPSTSAHHQEKNTTGSPQEEMQERNIPVSKTKLKSIRMLIDAA